MFTGIVTDLGEIESLQAASRLHRIRILCHYDQKTIANGASIACNGVCLTVVASGITGERTWFDVDVGAETLDVTTAKHWSAGTRINLERALKVGDELGGHLVAGHVDGIAAVVGRNDQHGMARFELRATRELARFLAIKGSVTLDGVSLTVNTVQDATFSVLAIPHTLNVTAIKDWRVASEVNIEVDLIARYAARLSEVK
jgi:riboflavin synthase